MRVTHHHVERSILRSRLWFRDHLVDGEALRSRAVNERALLHQLAVVNGVGVGLIQELDKLADPDNVTPYVADVLFDAFWQMAAELAAAFENDACSIYIYEIIWIAYVARKDKEEKMKR